MIYTFLIISDEDEMFLREIAIDADKTFLDFHDAISKSVNYDKKQMASFFICDDNWEKGQEITLIEMDTSSEYDNLTMDETILSDLVSDEGQKLLYVFDYMLERAFYIRLVEIETGKNLAEAVCINSEGTPPKQLSEDEDIDALLQKTTNFDTDFYGDEDFDPDELDNFDSDTDSDAEGEGGGSFPEENYL